jgi:hypothetical protein
MRRLRSVKAQLIATRKGVRYYLVAGKSELVAVRNHSDMEEVWDAEFQAVYADDNLSALDNFLSYGWGKFSQDASDFLVSIGHKDEGGNWMSYAGNLDNPEHIGTLPVLRASARGIQTCGMTRSSYTPQPTSSRHRPSCQSPNCKECTGPNETQAMGSLRRCLRVWWDQARTTGHHQPVSYATGSCRVCRLA